jgi:hypothetical protein
MIKKPSTIFNTGWLLDYFAEPGEKYFLKNVLLLWLLNCCSQANN